jgi:hypothetical protein
MGSVNYNPLTGYTYLPFNKLRRWAEDYEGEMDFKDLFREAGIEAVLAERAACASLAEETAADLERFHPDGSYDLAIDSLRALAHAIRGRSDE